MRVSHDPGARASISEATVNAVRVYDQMDDQKDSTEITRAERPHSFLTLLMNSQRWIPCSNKDLAMTIRVDAVVVTLYSLEVLANGSAEPVTGATEIADELTTNGDELRIGEGELSIREEELDTFEDALRIDEGELETG
jgi:hypothetical protein